MSDSILTFLNDTLRVKNFMAHTSRLYVDDTEYRIANSKAMTEMLLSGIFGKPRASYSGIEDSDMTALYFGYLASRTPENGYTAKVPAFGAGRISIGGVTLEFDPGYREGGKDVDAVIKITGETKNNSGAFRETLNNELSSFFSDLQGFLFECSKGQTVGGEEGQTFVAYDQTSYQFHNTDLLIPADDAGIKALQAYINENEWDSYTYSDTYEKGALNGEYYSDRGLDSLQEFVKGRYKQDITFQTFVGKVDFVPARGTYTHEAGKYYEQGVSIWPMLNFLERQNPNLRFSVDADKSISVNDQKTIRAEIGGVNVTLDFENQAIITDPGTEEDVRGRIEALQKAITRDFNDNARDYGRLVSNDLRYVADTQLIKDAVEEAFAKYHRQKNPQPSQEQGRINRYLQVQEGVGLVLSNSSAGSSGQTNSNVVLAALEKRLADDEKINLGVSYIWRGKPVSRKATYNAQDRTFNDSSSALTLAERAKALVTQNMSAAQALAIADSIEGKFLKPDIQISKIDHYYEESDRGYSGGLNDQIISQEITEMCRRCGGDKNSLPPYLERALATDFKRNSYYNSAIPGGVLGTVAYPSEEERALGWEPVAVIVLPVYLPNQYYSGAQQIFFMKVDEGNVADKGEPAKGLPHLSYWLAHYMIALGVNMADGGTPFLKVDPDALVGATIDTLQFRLGTEHVKQALKKQGVNIYEETTFFQSKHLQGIVPGTISSNLLMPVMAMVAQAVSEMQYGEMNACLPPGFAWNVATDMLEGASTKFPVRCPATLGGKRYFEDNKQYDLAQLAAMNFFETRSIELAVKNAVEDLDHRSPEYRKDGIAGWHSLVGLLKFQEEGNALIEHGPSKGFKAYDHLLSQDLGGLQTAVQEGATHFKDQRKILMKALLVGDSKSLQDYATWVNNFLGKIEAQGLLGTRYFNSNNTKLLRQQYFDEIIKIDIELLASNAPDNGDSAQLAERFKALGKQVSSMVMPKGLEEYKPQLLQLLNSAIGTVTSKSRSKEETETSSLIRSTEGPTKWGMLELAAAQQQGLLKRAQGY